MSRRPALATQADISRAIRALQERGLPITGVAVRGDGYYISTAEGNSIAIEAELTEAKRPIVL